MDISEQHLVQPHVKADLARMFHVFRIVFIAEAWASVCEKSSPVKSKGYTRQKHHKPVKTRELGKGVCFQCCNDYVFVQCVASYLHSE